MGDSMICQTVTASTTAELVRQRDLVHVADLVELRLDGVCDPDPAAALAGRRLPAIITCRPVWEGGRFDGSEEERRRLLEQAFAAGAEYVDVEWRAGFADLVAGRPHGRGVVLSMHDFEGIPADLTSVYAAMKQTGAEVVKIAVTARRLCDAFVFESLTPDPGPRTPDSVFIAMGPSGLATRMLAGRFGSRWTYAGCEAPGQMDIDRLVDQFRFRDITRSTAVYGVVGSRASTSGSPALHNAAFRAAGVDAVYLPLHTDDYDDFRVFADRLPLAGASVTMPFKEEALRHADQIDDIARAVGAVNTLRRSGGRWEATNTDVDGFLDPIRDMTLRGCRVAILGAGGAARAVAVAMTRQGARVSIFGRNRARTQAVAEMVGGSAFVGVPDKGMYDVLVNATPIGSAPEVDRTPMPATRLGGDIVYDLVYDPADTRLLREARAVGCRTVSGLQMLAAQACRQREWWFS